MRSWIATIIICWNTFREHKIIYMGSWILGSLWVSSQFGGVAGCHARGDGSAPRGFPAHSRVLSRFHVSLPLLHSLLLWRVCLGIKVCKINTEGKRRRNQQAFSTINYHDRECRQTANNIFCIVHHITSARPMYGNWPQTTWHVRVNCDFYY